MEIIIGIVCVDVSDMITFAHRKLFQEFIKVTTPAAANTDRILGIYILKKMPVSESPSILAASIRDGGNAFAFVLNIIISSGVASDGSIKPKTVFRSPSLEYIRNNGTISATNGIIIVMRITAYTLSFPLLRYISKPYPASELTIKANTVTATVYLQEFQKLLHSGCWAINVL